MDCIPQNSYVGALTLSIPNIEDKMFEDVVKLSEAISVASHPMWLVFYREKETLEVLVLKGSAV